MREKSLFFVKVCWASNLGRHPVAKGDTQVRIKKRLLDWKLYELTIIIFHIEIEKGEHKKWIKSFWKVLILPLYKYMDQHFIRMFIPH